MARSLARTGKTDLSDDELIICDSLWEYEHTMPLKLIYRDIFPDIVNIPYSHSIPDDRLEEALDALVARGVLSTETVIMTTRRNIAPYPHRVFGLTSLGGNVWELERSPDWQLYVHEECDDSDGNCCLISCLSPTIGQQFISARFGLNADEVFHEVLGRAPLVPWKEFASVHRFRVPFDPETDGVEIDWEAYERNRVWWSGTNELLRDRSEVSSN